MHLVSDGKLVAIGVKGVEVYVVHGVVFEEHPVASLFIGISQHGSHLCLVAVEVSLVSPFESTLYGVAVDVNRSLTIIGLWDVNNDDLLAVNNNRIYILVFQYVDVGFVSVDGIPKVSNGFCHVRDALDDKSFSWIRLTCVFLHTQEYCATIGVCKRRICFPDGFRQTFSAFFALQVNTFTVY